MPCVVILDSVNQLLIVKDSWCEKVNTSETRNHGNDRSSEMKIFYSKDKNLRPQFDLESSCNFDANKTACYDGYVLRVFGKYTKQRI